MRLAVCAAFGLVAADGQAGSLSDTVRKIKPSIVGVGTYQATRRPPAQLRGTGFVVGDGHHVITNAHVLPATTNREKREQLAVFVGKGPKSKVVRARRVAEDKDHDLAVLKIEFNVDKQLSSNRSLRHAKLDYNRLAGR